MQWKTRSGLNIHANVLICGSRFNTDDDVSIGYAQHHEFTDFRGERSHKWAGFGAEIDAIKNRAPNFDKPHTQTILPILGLLHVAAPHQRLQDAIGCGRTKPQLLRDKQDTVSVSSRSK